MRASIPMWRSLPEERKLEYLYEHTEELHEAVDKLTGTVERLRQQLSTMQRGNPGTSR